MELISVIIPTLNEAKTIGRLLDHLVQIDKTTEIIVVDGGSVDDTLAVVNQYIDIELVIEPEAGRAGQLNAGARQARGNILFFIHADSLPPEDAFFHIRNHLSEPGNMAGSFRLNFDRSQLFYRFLGWISSLNFPFTTYGDQGLFIRREDFLAIGGFSTIPVLEDLEIQSRIRPKGRFLKIQSPMLTSSRRFENNGPWKQLFLDGLIVTGYYLGISPAFLSRFYSNSIKKSR